MALAPNHCLNEGELKALLQLIKDGMDLKFTPDSVERLLQTAEAKLRLQLDLLK